MFSIMFTFGSMIPWCRIFPMMQPILNQHSEILCYIFFHRITSLQKDLNLLPPPNNMYKGLLMVVLYLIQNTSGAKGPLSARRARIRENQTFTSRTLPRLCRGLLKTRVVLPRKNIGSWQASGSVRMSTASTFLLDFILCSEFRENQELGTWESKSLSSDCADSKLLTCWLGMRKAQRMFCLLPRLGASKTENHAFLDNPPWTYGADCPSLSDGLSFFRYLLVLMKQGWLSQNQYKRPV